MINDFLNLPTIVLCTITVFWSAGLSVLALLIIRRKFHWELFKENHEVAGFLFNALGLIYAVLVAFVVYASWSDYQNASNNVDIEANLLHDLFLDAEGLPKHQHKIRENIFEYLICTINEEWNSLSLGKSNPNAKEKLMKLWKVYIDIDSLKTVKEQIVYSESFKRLNDLTNYRRLRILSSQQHIPALIWIVIGMGAMTSVGFSLFFGAKSLMIQSIMTGLFAMTNALVLLLIIVLDHPFTGDVKISNEAFQNILAYLQDYMINK